MFLSHCRWHRGGTENDYDPKDKKSISELQNARFARVVVDTKADRLVYQAKPRNIEAYDADAVSRIMREAEAPKAFQFGFSGMVSALTDKGIHLLGYNEVGKPHYSVQSILEKVKTQLGKVPAEFEVMLGRVLLGSTWVLQGRYASDAEILLHALLQSAIEREWAKGMGRYGVDIFQIQMLYNVRHIINDGDRNSLITKILNAASIQEMIDEIFHQYLSIKKKGQCNILTLYKLEQAVFTALPNNKALHQYQAITGSKLGFFSTEPPESEAPEESEAPAECPSVVNYSRRERNAPAFTIPGH